MKFYVFKTTDGCKDEVKESPFEGSVLEERLGVLEYGGKVENIKNFYLEINTMEELSLFLEKVGGVVFTKYENCNYIEVEIINDFRE